MTVLANAGTAPLDPWPFRPRPGACPSDMAVSAGYWRVSDFFFRGSRDLARHVAQVAVHPVVVGKPVSAVQACRGWESRCAGKRTARRRTAWLSSADTSLCSSGRTALMPPGASRDRSSSDTSADPRHAGLSSSSPRRSSSIFCRKRKSPSRGTRRPAVCSPRSAPPPRARRPTDAEDRPAPALTPRPRARPHAQLPRRASSGGQGSRRRADVARRRPEEPTGALLLEDVGRPAGHARAGEHRRRERRRGVGDVENDGRVVLDVRHQRALWVPLPGAPGAQLPRASSANVDIRRVELPSPSA